MKKSLLAALLSISLTAFAGDTLDQTMAELVAARDAITNAIVQKGGTVTSGALTNVPNEILSIPSGGTLGTATFTSNATYQASTDGFDGYSSVTVNVSGGGSTAPFKELISRQTNPTWTVSASDLAGATRIGASAFNNVSGLAGITIPDSVTEIANNAFTSCSGLTEIIIPDGVTTIGQEAFRYCSGLTNVVIGTGVTSIGSGAFGFCSGLTSITIPDGVTTIPTTLFSTCTSLQTIDFGTTRSTIPTLSSSAASGNLSAFKQLPSNYQILVPAALLEEWKTTASWDNSAVVDHIVAHP